MTHVARTAAAAGVAVVLATLLVGGVRPSELALIAAYQVAFVVGPGLWLIRPLPLANTAERLGAAWAVGTVASASLFLVGGAFGARGVVWLLPILAVMEVLRRPRTRWSPPALALPGALAALTVCTLGAVLLWLGLYGPNPLTRDMISGVQYQDLVYHLSLVGEVLHHGWPFQDPSVAGQPLHYQLLPHLDVASATFVTGVDPEVLLTRTQPVLALAAGASLAGGIGRRFGLAGGWALVPVLVLLLGGEVALRGGTVSFGNRALLGGDLLSPTELLAVPLMLTVVAALPARAARPWSRRLLAIWVLLGFGAMAAKVTVVPVVIAGIAFAVLMAHRRAALQRLALPVLALIVGALVAFGLFYAGSNANGLKPGLLAIVGGEGTAGKLERLAFVPFVALAPAFGAIAYLAVRRPPRDELLVWGPIGMFLASIVPYLALTHPGQSQVYFLRAGLAAVAPLAGVGVALGLQRLALTPVRLVAAGAALVLVVLGSRTADRVGGLTGSYLVGVPFLTAMAVIAAAAVLLAYVPKAGLWTRAITLAGVLVCVLSMADPFVDDEAAAFGVLRGRTLVRQENPDTSRGISREVRVALVWLRRHSSPSDVIAASNALQGSDDPRYFYYAALSQRRTYLEGWGYSDRSVALGPGETGRAFPQRVTLNRAAFAGDPSALRVLARDHGVRFLFLDRRYDAPPPPTRGLEEVYRNRQAIVYRLRAAALPRG